MLYNNKIQRVTNQLGSTLFNIPTQQNIQLIVRFLLFKKTYSTYVEHLECICLDDALRELEVANRRNIVEKAKYPPYYFYFFYKFIKSEIFSTHKIIRKIVMVPTTNLNSA